MLHKLKIPPQKKINIAGWKGHWPCKNAQIWKATIKKCDTVAEVYYTRVRFVAGDLSSDWLVWIITMLYASCANKESNGNLLNYKLPRKSQTPNKSWVWLWCPIKDTTYNNTNVYFDLHPPQCKSTPPSRLPLLRPGFRMLSFPHLSSTSWSQPMTLIVVWVHPGLKAPF